MTEPKLIANIWRTPTGEILQSKHRHDFVQDSAGNFIDGGIEGYTRIGGDILNENWENLCVYSDDPHEKKRELFKWGSRGGWVTPAEMTTEHIQAVLDTQKQIPEHIREMFVEELQYRKEQKMTEKCWSVNGEDYFDDWCRLIDELEQEELGVGTEYFEGDKVETQISDYVNIHGIVSMLGQFDDWVYEDVGEIADCDFYNVSKEAKEELQELIQQWAEKHVKLPYWKVQNVVKKVVTQEDLE